MCVSWWIFVNFQFIKCLSIFRKKTFVKCIDSKPVVITFYLFIIVWCDFWDKFWSIFNIIINYDLMISLIKSCFSLLKFLLLLDNILKISWTFAKLKLLLKYSLYIFSIKLKEGKLKQNTENRFDESNNWPNYQNTLPIEFLHFWLLYNRN